MNETSKALAMRRRRGDFARYLHGKGIDIGAGPDPLRVPRGSVTRWDTAQGDAQYMAGIADESFDFVYSSHCLEHLRSVQEASRNWARILRPGGYLYLVVPDFELYEKRAWPPRFNQTHRHTFSLEFTREHVGRSNHWHVYEDLAPVVGRLGIRILARILEADGYDYAEAWNVDQTRRPATLAQICVIGIKRKEAKP